MSPPERVGVGDRLSGGGGRGGSGGGGFDASGDGAGALFAAQEGGAVGLLLGRG